jgi:predicted MPP superfamily phosphohydrolase
MSIPKLIHDDHNKIKIALPPPRIIHISDTHFTDSSHTLDSGYWIDSQNSPLKSDILSDYIIKNQAQLGTNIIVITGDLTDSGEQGDYQIARSFIQKLKDNGFEVYCVPGNHDYSFEGNLFVPQAELPQTHTRKVNYRQYIDSNEYPQFIELNNCCLILLDSLKGEVDDRGNSLNIDLNAQGKLGDKQLADIKVQLADLQKARQTGKKVVVCLHHSPFKVNKSNLSPDLVMDEDSLSGLDDAEEFMAIINNNIDCLLFGHTSPPGELQLGCEEFRKQEQRYAVPIINCENLEHLAWYQETGFGVSAKQVCVGQNQDGRLEIFYIGTDNKIYHNWQKTPESDWHKINWNGAVALGGEAKQICVGQNEDGHLEVFYVGTNDTIYHNWQNGPNRTDSWHGQEVLGHSFFTGDDSARQICVGRYNDGRLAVFYIGTNLGIRYNWQNAKNISASWHGEERFGILDSGYQICVGQNQDGRLEIFYIGTDLEIKHRWQKTEGGWSDETSFSAHILQNTGYQICVGQNQDGRLEIFYIGTNLEIKHNAQIVPNGEWGGEESLGPLSIENLGYQICVGQNKDGRVEIFYIGTFLFIYHNYQKTPNGSWSGVELHSGLTEAGLQICVGQNKDGRLEIFYVGTNSHLYHNFQTIPDAAYPITVIDLARNWSEVYYTNSTTPIKIARGVKKPRFDQLTPRHKQL